MSRLLLLHTPHITSFHRQTLTSFLSNSKPHPSLSSLQFHHHRFSLSLFVSPSSPSPSLPLRTFSVRAFDSSETKSKEGEEEEAEKSGNEEGKTKKINSSESSSVKDSEYPSGEFQFEEFNWWRKFTVKLKMLTALPWERVRKGTVLTMNIRGQVAFLFFLHFYNLKTKISLKEQSETGCD